MDVPIEGIEESEISDSEIQGLRKGDPHSNCMGVAARPGPTSWTTSYSMSVGASDGTFSIRPRIRRRFAARSTMHLRVFGRSRIPDAQEPFPDAPRDR